jgi:hypothetical protein
MAIELLTKDKKKMFFANPGEFDSVPVQANFDFIFRDIATFANEITALASRQTWTVVKMFEQAGMCEIMGRGKHLRCKCIGAFATLADSAERPTESKYNGDMVRFTATEGAGKARAFRLKEGERMIHYNDVVEVQQTENRKVIYTFTFESMEE